MIKDSASVARENVMIDNDRIKMLYVLSFPWITTSTTTSTFTFTSTFTKNYSVAAPVALILGSGPRVGAAVAKTFVT
ncbi:hypothetical protein N7465_010089 [Penicillium sp. CMV-2018d]|nr:hypothetical protein N7465_010089 [Penicillium sp. CMV-2018d]